jgi:hypothetical protein
LAARETCPTGRPARIHAALKPAAAGFDTRAGARYSTSETGQAGEAAPYPQCGGLSALSLASFSVPVPRGSSGVGVGSLPGGGSVVTRRRLGRGFGVSEAVITAG